MMNTPGTAGRSGFHDRTLAEEVEKTPKNLSFLGKKIKLPKKIFFLHISSSYAKILGETNVRTWEIPRSGSKAKDGEKKKRTSWG